MNIEIKDDVIMEIVKRAVEEAVSRRVRDILDQGRTWGNLSGARRQIIDLVDKATKHTLEDPATMQAITDHLKEELRQQAAGKISAYVQRTSVAKLTQARAHE